MREQGRRPVRDQAGEQPWEIVPGGGVTTPLGFHAAGVACGIKRKGRDLALVTSVVPARVAAFFTTNEVKAAPVRVSMCHARKGIARAIVINSGNANAYTGVGGIRDALEMARFTAKLLRCRRSEVLVCSTGRIGRRLPMEKVCKGICRAWGRLSPEGGKDAALAILTTDTRPKEVALRFSLGPTEVVIGAMAKGSGIIHPRLATTLCIVTTNVAIEPQALYQCAWSGVAQSFNRILVDGATSTNDTLIVLANGLARNWPLGLRGEGTTLFQEALRRVLRMLARKILEDEEGITQVVEIVVRGAGSQREAELGARAVAQSVLVKCAWHAREPGWGRIMDALGCSGARVREELVDIFYNGVQMVRQGEPILVAQSRVRKMLSLPHLTVAVDLHVGKEEYSLLTTDLTAEYVRRNGRE
ncbi:bifunctional glutamate N-acetyltransferase/amino-acid acetyltransferase ArgJ [Candidatus Methylacidithermus pantelleriae]|nr:bifunctional glutamate N-acetyltransferase/amino-acid acetyltransferase ArgJ [Candidatus Methylacidithermus pantelleriae]